MHKIRAEKFANLIALLHEADAIQQELLGELHQVASYEFHNELNNLADELEEFAANEEKTG